MIIAELFVCQPKISVIVPVYKVEPYLGKCLDSIIGQTYHILEIILIDDGSPDRCGEICDEYAAKDPRIHVIHQQNAGLSAARNAGLDIASGDYIMFVDSDDWVEKNTCETVLMIAQQQQADIVCYGYNEVSSSGKILKSLKGISGEIDKVEILNGIISGRSFLRDYSWNKFCYRKLFDDVRFPVGRLYEDIGTTYKLLHHAKKVWMVETVLYNYVSRDGSIVGSPLLPNHVEDRIFLFKERLEFLKAYYPEIVNLQIVMFIRELLIDRDRIEGKQGKCIINEELKQIVGTYKTQMPSLVHYSKIVWVYYYCPILVRPFMRLRRLTHSIHVM